MKKYIVNNLQNQSIEGNLRVDGLDVLDGNYRVGTYKALLTNVVGDGSTGAGSDKYTFFIKGSEYEIVNYVAGDDFTNIGASSNATGVIFVATGDVPASWSAGSEVANTEGFSVEVLENTLGHDIYWSKFGPGAYAGFNAESGPVWNDFDRSKTSVSVSKSTLIPTETSSIIYSLPTNLLGKDDVIFVFTSGYGFTMSSDMSISMAVDENTTDGHLRMTPIEIKKKQNISIATVFATASYIDLLPFGSVTMDLYSGSHQIGTFYSFSGDTATTLSELATILNSSPASVEIAPGVIFTGTSYLGSYSVVDETIVLQTTESKFDQLSDSYLSLVIYAD